MFGSVTRRTVRPVVAAGVLVAVFTSVAIAAAGRLDSTFSGDGKTTTDLTPREDWASAVVIQPDGKIVVAGVAGWGKRARIGLARYRTNGRLDTTFGGGDGKVTTNLTKGIDNAFDMALQPDGKIVATGEAGFGMPNPRIGVVRYNADGTLDTSFGGGDGKVLTDVTGREDWGDGVAIQSDGKIVVGGGCGYSNALKKGAVWPVRYNADGTIDTGFGTGGSTRVDVTPTRDFANSLTLQSDGKIVLAGESGFGSPNPNFVIVRLDGSGNPDPTFSGNGIRTVPVTMRHDAALAVRVQPDGNIVAAGGGGWSGRHPSKFAAVRLTTGGKLDPTFAGDGIRITALRITNSMADGLAIQPDGKLVLVGWAGNRIAVTRWNSDGSFDTSFSGDGQLTTRLTRHGDAVYAVALQADGRIVVAGEAGYAGSNPKIAVLRYNGS